MRAQFDPAVVFGIRLCVSVLLFYFIYLQLRRWKFRRIANNLGAKFLSQGLFKSGAIAGSMEARKYTITTRDVTVGRASSTWTTTTIDCVNKGIPLQLDCRFFNPFPNWRFAYSTGDRTEKVLSAELVLQNAPIPLEEKYKPQIQRLLQEFAMLYGGTLKKGSLRIYQEEISFATRGVLKSAAAAKAIILLLEKVADRVEATPVT
jgi:hypothetical protein